MFSFYKNKKNFTFALVVLSSSMYLTQIMVSPIYFMSIAAFFLVLLQSNSSNLQFRLSNFIVSILFSSYFLISQYLVTPINTVGNIFAFSLITILMAIHFENIDDKVVKHIVKLFLILSLLLFACDAVWRFVNPGYDKIENLERLGNLGLTYIVYKINSIMYIDSNIVGFHALILFMLSVVMKDVSGIRYIRLLLFIAVACTLSRAAFISALLGVAYYLVDTSIKSRLFTHIIYLSVALFSVFYFSFQFSTEDISLTSKFFLLNSAISVVSNAFDNDLFDFFFGIGLGESVNLLGIGSHSLYVTLLVETGVVGFIVYMSYLFYLYSLSRKVKYILFPVFVTSFSLGSLIAPYLIVACWLVIYRSRNIDT